MSEPLGRRSFTVLNPIFTSGEAILLPELVSSSGEEQTRLTAELSINNWTHRITLFSLGAVDSLWGRGFLAADEKLARKYLMIR